MNPPIIPNTTKDVQEVIAVPYYIKHGNEFVLLPEAESISLLTKQQQDFKRKLDILCASFELIFLSPLLLYVAVRTKFSGSIFYYQERIGKNGKPFLMIKFRSMVEHAEKNGPQLSYEEDNRITSWGKIMRRWRFDELPQLWNILKGDMSLIGPRPEREFFIQQIIAKYPHYKNLLQVKPGLSSWGMVQFGYAENIEEMIDRSRYDFYYLQNNSLYFDVKVVLGTLGVILTGK